MNHDNMHTQNNTLLSAKTFSICFALIAMAIVAVTVFKLSVSIVLLSGALLACPLLHVWMMKNGGHKH